MVSTLAAAKLTYFRLFLANFIKESQKFERSRLNGTRQSRETQKKSGWQRKVWWYAPRENHDEQIVSCFRSVSINPFFQLLVIQVSMERLVLEFSTNRITDISAQLLTPTSSGPLFLKQPETPPPRAKTWPQSLMLPNP